MKVNLVEKGSMPIVEDALFRTLKQIYVGEDLWLSIDEISLDFCASEDTDDPIVLLKIRYGRNGDKADLNFYDDVTLSCDDREVDLQFLCGRFFQHVDTADLKYGE